MRIKDLLSVVGNGIMYVLTIAQTREIFQIIELVLAILISIVILFGKIIDWYHKAKKDGKITKEEIKELVEITKDDIEDIKDKVNKGE